MRIRCLLERERQKLTIRMHERGRLCKSTCIQGTSLHFIQPISTFSEPITAEHFTAGKITLSYFNTKCGGNGSAVDSSVPTTLRSWVRIANVFSIYIYSFLSLAAPTH